MCPVVPTVHKWEQMDRSSHICSHFVLKTFEICGVDIAAASEVRAFIVGQANISILIVT